MQDIITGIAYVVGDDVDTDQIIPAEYLMYNPSVPAERKLFGRYAMVGVPPAGAGLPKGRVPFVDQTDESNSRSRFSIVIGGRNFGCGSSREHAPLALAEAGVQAVVAEDYARIFFRNSVNGGYLVPFQCAQRLCESVQTGDELEIRVAEGLLRNKTRNTTHKLEPLGDVAPIIEAGGVFEYAKRTGMLK
ncbi:MAG: 3-isopropylmalate dehydratase small subunit [Phycisphaerae bacterium]|nr:3-isopropylmalate dehydratase small subunit [Phycisphaerae bacterium]